MTQRIFDVENEKDMQDLWSILPDRVIEIEVGCGEIILTTPEEYRWHIEDLIAINWHDKTEIKRPMPESTEDDKGKLCVFWDFDDGERKYGILRDVSHPKKFQMFTRDGYFYHCRRLTKQEIEELC